MAVDKARNTALNIIYNINSNCAFINIELKRVYKENLFSSLDRAFITRLVYGTIEKQISIDYVVNIFAKGKLNAWIKNILRLGAYQILYLDKVPDSAACNESVKLAQKYSYKAKGLVNAVLRNIVRNKDDILSKLEHFKKTNKSIGYSYPKFIVELWKQSYDEAVVERILKESSEQKYTTIRINRLQQDQSDKRISDYYEVNPGYFLQNAFRIKLTDDIEKNEMYRNGIITVQGETSMLAAEVLASRENDTILDACSAPGGKAIYISEIINNKGTINAWDVNPSRVRLIKQNSKRMKADIVHAFEKDATVFYESEVEKYDRVLLDVPCSGLGVINKKPDIKHRLKRDDMNSLVAIQKSIINNCSKYVKLNGTIVYCTCTVNKKENENVVLDFINRHKSEFALVDIDIPENLHYSNYIKKKGMVQILPNKNGLEGFFISLIRRIS